MGDVLVAIGILLVFALPLAVSVTALLDAARRPGWVWALARRSQVVWMALILFGTIVVPLGLVVSIVYLTRVRPVLTAAESGQIDL